MLPICVLAQPAQGFQQGQIGVMGTVVLRALPTGKPQPAPLYDIRTKDIDGCGLADARLPSQEKELALAALGMRQALS